MRSFLRGFRGATENVPPLSEMREKAGAVGEPVPSLQSLVQLSDMRTQYQDDQQPDLPSVRNGSASLIRSNSDELLRNFC